MAIDGLIILDDAGRPIVQSGFRSHNAAYPLLHIDAFNAAPRPVDPVLALPLDPLSACCHVSYSGGLHFLAPISGHVDPLLAFAFIRTFTEILQEYFGMITPATLRDNFDVVYQLLEETLDSSGHPLTTSPGTLKDIVIPPSLFNKILSSIGPSGMGSATGSSAFNSPIPWRKAGIKHNHNEIYFDIVERLEGIVNKHGSALTSNVWGRIESKSRLSGTPDILLTFANPKVMMDCAFHPCVRLQRFARDRAFSFVPPDGSFTLADYRLAPNPSLSAPTTTPIPMSLRATLDTPSNKTVNFSFSLTSRSPSSQPLEHLSAEFVLGNEAGGVSATLSGIIAGSSWTFDAKKRALRWELLTLPSGATATIKGTFSAPNPRPAKALVVNFSIPAYAYSGLRVDQMKIVGGEGTGYKPYKGVRSRSEGSVEFRI